MRLIDYVALMEDSLYVGQSKFIIIMEVLSE